MFRIWRRFVLHVPLTVKYSQLLIPKNKTLYDNWPSALSFGVKILWHIVWNTDSGNEFCCFLDGSVSVYPAICLTRKRGNLLLVSRAGSDSRFVWKVEWTCVMVEWTVHPVNTALLVLPNWFLRQLLANADKRWVLCCCVNSASYSSEIPMAWRNLFNRL